MVTTGPGITSAATYGGTSSLTAGTATGSPAPIASWTVVIPGHANQIGEGDGTINWPDVDTDTDWSITVTWSNGVGVPAVATIGGTIIADTGPEPPTGR